MTNRRGKDDKIAPEVAGDPYLGVVVNGYEITERVGAGQIGTVYKAVRSNPDDAVACKIITENKLRPGWQTEIEKNATIYIFWQIFRFLPNFYHGGHWQSKPASHFSCFGNQHACFGGPIF